MSATRAVFSRRSCASGSFEHSITHVYDEQAGQVGLYCTRCGLADALDDAIRRDRELVAPKAAREPVGPEPAGSGVPAHIDENDVDAEIPF